MCDSKCGGGSGGGVSNSGPPENLPAWLKCPPTLREKSYPVPQGVEIIPISQGGRNGSSSKKKFKCGQCGQDKPPVNAKPNVSADCPMMKKRCEDNESKSGGSILDKIKSIFGIGKDPRLVELCQKLNVPDEQIRHHREVFSPQLFVRKDGYMSPFITKVDCQGANEEEDQEYDEDCEDEEYEDGEYEEEECVEDEEGECILEESAECLDEDCKLFFDDDDTEDKQADCAAMNNFIIRVQAPFTMSSTNETCEQIISRLTSRSKQYPEPGPRPEKKAKTEDEGEDVELVIKGITVEDPSCDCPPMKKKCKKKPKQGASSPPPPTPDPPAPPPPPSPATNTIPAGMCPQNEGIPCPPPSSSEAPPPPPPPLPEKEQINTEPPPSETGPSEPPPPQGPPQNDCETLSEAELLSKKLKEIKCGCPKPCGCPGATDSPFPGLTCYGGVRSVWTPPPPPGCPRCGTAIRGDTDGCYLCHITRRMRSGIPEARQDLPEEFRNALEITEPAGSCKAEYLDDGSIKYKGGFCLSLTEKFLWHLEKRNPPGGFFDRFRGTCGEKPPPLSKDPCEEKIAYKGGMSIKNCCDFLFGKIPEEEVPPPPRKCKSEEPKQSNDKCPPPK